MIIMINEKVAQMLYGFALFLEIGRVPFKPRAYEKAAYTIESLDTDIREIYKAGGLRALWELPGIGKGIAEKIEEFLETGSVKEYERIRKKMPINIEELGHIEGIGPQTLKVLYTKLGVKDLASLKKAALAGKIRKLPHFGYKSEEKILKAIGFHERSGGRFLLGEILPMARNIREKLLHISGVKRVEIGGSLRRFEETVGDIDLLAQASHPQEVTDFFAHLPEVAHVYAKGKTKSSVRLAKGIDMDLRIVPSRSFGAALQYFTGNKDHNIMMRKLAIQKGYKLNEYGLFRGSRQAAGETEESIYKALGVPMPIPELRQGRDELEKTYRGVIQLSDLRGDFQVQTDWTDGSGSILQMAERAKALGHEYIAITDHTKSLAMTGGSDERKLQRQMAEIDRLQKKLSGIKILKGAEVNILKDGLLDIDSRVLKKLDIVGAAVHSLFKLSRHEQTLRIIRAMENPHVDIIFHPTGRVLHKRDPYQVDMEVLLEAARRTGTVMEIDAHPWRLDLKDEHIRMGKKKGIYFSIDSDAHSPVELSLLEYGVGQARRAGLEKSHVLNTYPLGELKKILSMPKEKRFS